MEDVEAVNGALPDYIGFVFAQSRRRVDPGTAALLKGRLDPRIDAVGVFVNESIDTVAGIYKSGVIDMVQLHGDEDGEYICRLRDACGCKVAKAVGVGVELPPLPTEPDYLLFDALSEGRGGAGRAFDWHILEAFDGLQYFLAGGLSIENVADALAVLTPYCVDVSSGVETGGVKDARKIIEFVRLARGLGR
jgi:phosphoribosylanthranilate isomerase